MIEMLDVLVDLKISIYKVINPINVITPPQVGAHSAPEGKRKPNMMSFSLSGKCPDWCNPQNAANIKANKGMNLKILIFTFYLF